MVGISDNVLKRLRQIFTSAAAEQCCLLGCSRSFAIVDHAEPARAGFSSVSEITIDSAHANQVIKSWRSQGVCFCGVIHSHIGGCPVFSAQDIAFAKSLLSAFKLPFIVFGLILPQGEGLLLNIYKASVGFGGIKFDFCLSTILSEL